MLEYCLDSFFVFLKGHQFAKVQADLLKRLVLNWTEIKMKDFEFTSKEN